MSEIRKQLQDHIFDKEGFEGITTRLAGHDIHASLDALQYVFKHSNNPFARWLAMRIENSEGRNRLISVSRPQITLDRLHRLASAKDEKALLAKTQSELFELYDQYSRQTQS